MKSLKNKHSSYPSVITNFPLNSLKKNNLSSKFSFMKSLPSGVFAVSLFGLFLGASTTMVYSQLGLFMKNELHASELKIAFIDGMVEFIAYFIRVFSGVVTDYFMNRKVILLVGCALTFFMKPIFAIAQSPLIVLIAQSIERIGNGLQATPRDALIADLSDSKTRGVSFGFSKSFKTVGSMCGTCIAMLIMLLTCDNYRMVFLCSTISVAIAILCLFKIKTKQEMQPTAKTLPTKMGNPFKKEYLKSLDSSFWKMIALAVIFELGHFSEALFPIYANQFLSTTAAGSVSLFISIGQVLCSLTIGLCADKYGKRRFIKMCILMMIASNIFFMSATSIISVYVAAFLWGGQMTSVQAMFLAIISEKVDKHLIGTAIGIYYCAIGASYLIASTIAGEIWSTYGNFYSFVYSICFCIASLALFKILLSKKYTE
jgi:MFS family permease